jgi:hypothetical protein
MTTLENRPNSALLVIDVQNGVVGEAYERDKVVSTIAGLVDKARDAGVDVVWVQHNDDQMTEGSEAWQYVPELVRRQSEALVHKRYGDSFEETDLEQVLAERDRPGVRHDAHLGCAHHRRPHRVRGSGARRGHLAHQPVLAVQQRAGAYGGGRRRRRRRLHRLTGGATPAISAARRPCP